ncbi:hypothetical protein A3I51_01155 [Candidatus Gottesmanbacteria bacterium RIFCSPLOWO2_02_FULL_38_8]|uniref:Aminotransferase DegT n=1 Tax=Candidatus Gottesmanbacteria bacterium RIFCSPLOWO2_02_FULL_38_8 TaxID=1798397 RepID=A0A1F6B518_9BACT|nr:MAG: hypothetical protein A3I51_01155 [Candidatus Gottesmanbacteria bacterium RIFCSPLOWO2_02_FULL_38_8]
MIPISKPLINKKEIEAVTAVLKTGYIVQGTKTIELENKFVKLTGAKYSVAVNSGTAALHTALYSIGISKGDEVITTPFTFIATVNSILMVGARPVFVDIDEKSFNLDPNKIESAITRKTRAILVVNLYGQPANYDAINKIAQQNKLLVVEDAAQSVNAEYKNIKSGNLADTACFSFYATKNIMCGEGGMITTNNGEYFGIATKFRNHGQDENVKYEYHHLGYNYRLMDLQAAIALIQLKRLFIISRKRQQIAQKYNLAFRNIKGLIIPYKAEDTTHVYHQYTLRITKEFKLTRDELKKYLESKGIQSNIYYPKPLYYFNHLKQFKSDVCDITERISKEVLSIPIHPLLNNKEINYVINSITSI